MNDNKSRDIFYGVVAVATLIVALIGATLAYFSITVNSSEGAVNAKSAVVSINYEDGQQVTASADKLIPASLNVVKAAYMRSQADFGQEGAMRSNICVDDNSNQVCSIYRFSVSDSNNSGIGVIATLNSEKNTFTDLAYAVRDVTNNTWINLDPTEGTVESMALDKCDNDDDEVGNCYTADGSGAKTFSANNPIATRSIFGYNTSGTANSLTVGSTAKVYDIVLFIKNKDESQNYDQDKSYSGTIVVSSTEEGAGKIYGQIEGVTG